MFQCESWGQKIEGQGHEAQKTSHCRSSTVFDRNAILSLAAYVSFAGFSPRPMLLPTAGFSIALSSSQQQKTFPAWVVALLRVLAASSEPIVTEVFLLTGLIEYYLYCCVC